MARREAWRLKQSLKNEQRKIGIDLAVRGRPEVSLADRAWAAGCFEGEGTATIVNSDQHTRGIVTLTNTDRSLVEFFQARWPGTLRHVPSKNPKHRDRYSWTLNTIEQSLRFIADVLPLMVSERNRQRLEILNYTQRIRVRGSRDLALRNELQDARATMAMLNRKGPGGGVVVGR